MSRIDGREAVERDDHTRLRDLTARARAQAAEARDRWAEARATSREREEASREELIAALKRSTAKQAALDRRRAETDAGRAQQVALRHEIVRARRSGEPFVLAFISIEGDVEEVIAAVGSKLRSHDPIVRISDTEFVCGMSATPLETSDQRMTEIQEAVERRRLDASMRVALAQLGPNEIVEAVLQRGNGE